MRAASCMSSSPAAPRKKVSPDSARRRMVAGSWGVVLVPSLSGELVRPRPPAAWVGVVHGSFVVLGHPSPVVSGVDAGGPRAFVSVSAPPGQVDFAVAEVARVRPEGSILLIDCEADAEFGPAHECRAPSGAEIAGLAGLGVPGMGLHDERYVACPDRVERLNEGRG